MTETRSYLSKSLKYLRKWLAPVLDPVWAAKGMWNYPRYWADWYQYAHLPNAEPIRFADGLPMIHDRSATHATDVHYFFVNAWAMRRVVATAPHLHVDVGSQVTFPSLLAGAIPVVFIDYRPLRIRLSGLECMAGSLLALPFIERSIISLSCLHVVEHIGLGRYGDPLDPEGTVKAARELARVLAPHGNLFLALPIGRPRVCFNAHRIHAPHAVCNMFAGLGLVEFSGIHDDGRFVEHAHLSDFQDSEYACGLYWFRKADE